MPPFAAPNTQWNHQQVEKNAVGGSDQTVLIEDAATVSESPYLLRKRNGQSIPIDQPLFRIGRERESVDYCVADNAAVGRRHASIITRDKQYYIIDLNSTNHTFVNGKKAEPNTENKLSHGTKLKFANEEFEFKLY
jgi:pSer/pThr/pTyr-binding forkhead associated (FHA) protein